MSGVEFDQVYLSFFTAISKMTFDYGATVKNLTLTFWPKIFFKVNIHVEKPGKNFGTKS